MRSLGFDLTDDVLLDEYAVIVDIYTETPGGDDDDGNPMPPVRTYYAQGAEGDLQPKGGTQRAAESGTVYESTHVLFLHQADATVPVGANVDMTPVGGGDMQTMTVVFVANRGTHLEIDLK